MCFFQGNGEIGARSIAVFIGKNHTILAHDRADTGDDAAAGMWPRFSDS